MMNFWLLLAVVVACAIVWAAHRYLSRSATIWLGVLLVAVSGMALMLDFLNDGIRTSILSGHKSTTGQSLFAMGPEISILGAGWNFALLALLCGVVLIVVGFFKRVAKQSSDADNANIDDATRIERELDDAIDELSADWNPAALGQQDATQTTGAVPGGHETRPTGTERNMRDRYRNLAKDFLLGTVRALQKEIADAFGTLSNVMDSVAATPYQKIAHAHYNELRPKDTDQQINAMRIEIMRARTAVSRFAEKLGVASEELEWTGGNTPTRKLIMWGAFFVLAEFLANYWLLKDEIGAQQAVFAAFLAVAIILFMSFICAWLLQFVRRGPKLITRIGVSLLCLFLFTLFLCAFGLLLGWRDATATDIVDAEGAAATLRVSMDVIANGYAASISNTPNITVLIINLLAFGVFAWKVALWTDKFRGYGNLKQRLDNALADWDDFLQSHEDSVRDALKEASDKAYRNAKDASAATSTIRKKTATLENIRQIIGGAYTAKLHPAYSFDIQEYRRANAENRELEVDPTPKFWREFPELCEVNDHFTADLKIDNFFKDNRVLLDNIESYLQSVRQKIDEWHSQSAALGTEWSEGFDARINNIVLGNKGQ